MQRLLIFVLVLAFLGTSAAFALTLLASSQGRVMVNALDGAVITPATFSLNGNPGQTVTSLFSVANTGNTTRTFVFGLVETCVGVDWGATLNPASISLFPGDSGGVTLSVPIPATAQGGAYCDYRVDVSADTGGPPPIP